MLQMRIACSKPFWSIELVYTYDSRLRYIVIRCTMVILVANVAYKQLHANLVTSAEKPKRGNCAKKVVRKKSNHYMKT